MESVMIQASSDERSRAPQDENVSSSSILRIDSCEQDQTEQILVRDYLIC